MLKKRTFEFRYFKNQCCDPYSVHGILMCDVIFTIVYNLNIRIMFITQPNIISQFTS